jgi:hypothetical protein
MPLLLLQGKLWLEGGQDYLQSEYPKVGKVAVMMPMF